MAKKSLSNVFVSVYVCICVIEESSFVTLRESFGWRSQFSFLEVFDPKTIKQYVT